MKHFVSVELSVVINSEEIPFYNVIEENEIVRYKGQCSFMHSRNLIRYYV